MAESQLRSSQGYEAIDISPVVDHSHTHDHHFHRHDDHKAISVKIPEPEFHNKDDEKNLSMMKKAVLLTTMFMLVEFAGGIAGHSLALMTDALHMLTDIFSFMLAIYAISAASKPPTRRFTFGFRRIEVIASLGSTLLIWLLTASLMYEAGVRLVDFSNGRMEDVDGQVRLVRLLASN
jgi:Co/Zn/Cd efflux system component